MKNLIFAILSILGISCNNHKKEDVVNNHYIIDMTAQSTPLINPYLCLAFSREYCDSVKAERELKLKYWAYQAKNMKDEKEALLYFMSRVSELRSDIRMDYMRAVNKSLNNN